MSLTRHFNRLFVLLSFAIFIPAMAQAPEQTAPATNIVTAKIKLDDLSMIIVPVSINGSGPYDFLLDTGCAKTIVDQKLADQLGLPRAGEKTVVGILASTRMSVVHVNSLSVAGASVPGGDIFSSDHPATVTSNVRGVLGEDFLRNFDLLIDYRHQTIRIESPLGSMAQTALGEHLPLQLTGCSMGSRLTTGWLSPATFQNSATPRCCCSSTPAQTAPPSSATASVQAQPSRNLCAPATSINGSPRQHRHVPFGLSAWEATLLRT